MGGASCGGSEGKFEIFDVFQANFPKFCQHLTTRRAMNVNELSSISKTISCQLKVTLLLLQ